MADGLACLGGGRDELVEEDRDANLQSYFYLYLFRRMHGSYSVAIIRISPAAATIRN
jgi:hypothetical protein